MNRKPLMVGIVAGVLVGCGTAVMAKPKTHHQKRMIGKTLRAMGDVVDSVTGGLNW